VVESLAMTLKKLCLAEGSSFQYLYPAVSSHLWQRLAISAMIQMQITTNVSDFGECF